MSQIKNDNDEAITFLKTWAVNGPWVLTAIDSERHGIRGKVFQPTQEKSVRECLDDCFENERNVYFHVNEVHNKVKTKASKDDVRSVTHLHVDIDPRAGEDLASEQARILKLAQNPPEGVPAPTFINYSGGGYQAFWELEEPIEINFDVEKAEKIELYNIQLEVLYKADNCHNVDRIMRLPGTVNCPDAKKKAKGRTKQLAKVIQFNETCVYPLSEFTAAVHVHVDTGFASTVQVQIEGNIERAESIDTLKAWAAAKGKSFPDWLGVVIVQGNNPEKPSQFTDRSKAVFAVCCEMARMEFTDTQMYSVITDPDFGISASVLDKGSGVDRYAKRQIERCRESAISDDLLRTNERHAVISSYGGKCVIIEEVYDEELGRKRLDKQSFGDFKNRYINIKVDVGEGKTKALGDWWIHHKDRRQYDGITFAPAGCGPKTYNLWQGFSCDAIKGDCGLLLEHIENNICGKNTDHFEFLLDWMARAVQYPGRQGEIAVILRGRMGVGKGRLVQYFGELFGRHFLQVSDPKHLVGSFNQHLRDCVILFGDEAFFAGDKKHEGTLKTLITEKYLMVEPKGVDAAMAPNYTHLIMASNSDWVIPAGMEERRYFVLDCKADRMQDTQYFNNIDKQMTTGGNEALLHLLKTRDISKFNHRRAPKTDALQEQKELSMEAEMSWWYEKLTSGKLLPDADGWTGRAPIDALYQDYIECMDDLKKFHRMTKTVLGRFLRKVNPKALPRKRYESVPNLKGHTVRQSVYLFDDLNKTRDHWDNLYFDGEWIEDPGDNLITKDVF